MRAEPARVASAHATPQATGQQAGGPRVTAQPEPAQTFVPTHDITGRSLHPPVAGPRAKGRTQPRFGTRTDDGNGSATGRVSGRNGPAFDMRIDADPSAVRTVLGKLMHWLEVQGIGADDRNSTEIVLAEALNNIVEHAYAGAQLRADRALECVDEKRHRQTTSNARIRLRLRLGTAALVCVLTDRGFEMPGRVLPLSSGPPDPDSAAEPAEGGYGWFLIRTLTDALHYRRLGTTNRLSLNIPLTEMPQTEDAILSA